MSWTAKSSAVVLDANLKQQISKFADLLPFNIVITDGIRSPRTQVLRMYAKLDKTPPEDLRDIYLNDDFADEVMDAYPDIDDGIAVVEKYLAIAPPSSHLVSLGFDVRTRDKSNSQIQEMIQVSKNLGWKPFLEPDHLHITITPPKKNFLIVGAIIGVLALWILRK